MDTKAILKAIELFDTKAAFAKAIGNVNPALVWQWANGIRPVAAHHCIAIETATELKVTRHDLRPDVFGSAPVKRKAA